MKIFTWQSALLALQLCLTGVEAGFRAKSCQVWPRRTIPYCFQANSISTKTKDRVKSAFGLWESKGAPATFINTGNCEDPASPDYLADILVVREIVGADFMSSTVGYRGPGYEQSLTIGTFYDFHKLRVTNSDWVGAIAHEIGHVMCLLNENQRPDLKSQLDLKCKNTIEYRRAAPNDREKVMKACGDIREAATRKMWGPFQYVFYPNSDHLIKSDNVDWGSIMLQDGKAFSSRGKVITKTDGSSLKSSWKDGPSDGDISFLKTFWNEDSAPPLPPRPVGEPAYPPPLPARPQENPLYPPPLPLSDEADPFEAVPPYNAVDPNAPPRYGADIVENAYVCV
ncbi:hypothetical protein N7492_000733 [Penicillium capsulatum]|uniref:Peptidase M12A domain-containing protein n=1 Tax=Penicillium capsulatum TaxID=69766 RepID=A0A9W9ISG6_9EURO|nr:hypothetical protein N7492_000733 [Penicillium capsulatum]KAJ6130208.1 hypothetical protein N7512_002988 [Penicillium capsulatum]